MKKIVLSAALLVTPCLAVANSDFANADMGTGYSDLNSRYSQSALINQIGSDNRAFTHQQGTNNHSIIVQQGK